MTLAEFRRAFWARVEKKGPNDCWPWLGPTNSGGYGVHTVPRELRSRFLSRHGAIVASRIAFSLKNGPLIEGMTTHHTCFNPICQNPRHLTQISRSENCSRQWESERLFRPVAPKERCPILAAILQEELNGSTFYDRINQKATPDSAAHSPTARMETGAATAPSLPPVA